jgi:hypothetical protein
MKFKSVFSVVFFLIGLLLFTSSSAQQPERAITTEYRCVKLTLKHTAANSQKEILVKRKGEYTEYNKKMYNIQLTIENCGAIPISFLPQSDILNHECIGLTFFNADSVWDLAGVTNDIAVLGNAPKTKEILAGDSVVFDIDVFSHRHRPSNIPFLPKTLQAVFSVPLDNKCGFFIAKSNVIDLPFTDE